MDKEIAEYVLSQPHWKDHPQWVEKLIEIMRQDVWFTVNVLTQPHWKDHPQWVEKLIEMGRADEEIAKYVLTELHWKSHFKKYLGNHSSFNVKNLRKAIKKRKQKEELLLQGPACNPENENNQFPFGNLLNFLKLK